MNEIQKQLLLNKLITNDDEFIKVNVSKFIEQ